MHNFPAFTVLAGFLAMIVSSCILSLLLSAPTSRSILSSSNHRIEQNLKSSVDDKFGNVTTADFPGAVPRQTLKSGIPIEEKMRVLNAFTQHTVTAQSLTQELYGIIDFPEAATTATFQGIYDEYVESYFSLKVDPTLFLNSKVTITNVLMPSITDRYFRRQSRDLEISQDFEGKREGSSVIITYDQQLSYYFPIAGGTLALETLVGLPFLTENGRNEFNLKLKDSKDIILQDVIGVSEVDLPPQSPTAQPINPPAQLPAEPVDLPPQPLIGQPNSSPTQLPAEPVDLPPQYSTTKPISSPTQVPAEPVDLPPQYYTTKPISSPPQLSAEPVDPPRQPIRTMPPVPPPSKSPVPPPVVAPMFPETARPTPIPTKAKPLEKDVDSGGFSGLILIGSLMVLLFIFFTINMKYCMGEYAD